MIILISLVALAYLFGMFVMMRSLNRSPEGYEDELGFHHGRANQGEVIVAVDAFVAEEAETMAA